MPTQEPVFFFDLLCIRDLYEIVPLIEFIEVPTMLETGTVAGKLPVGTDEPSATLILKGCRLMNVYSGEIYTTDISIDGEIVTSIEPRRDYSGAEVIDCAGLFAAPGMIDAHMHVDTTYLWANELARVLVPLGTTSLFVDTTNIAHTGGVDAVEAMMQSFDGLPLRGFTEAPSYCPIDPSKETAAAEFTSREIGRLLDQGCHGIGETLWSKIGQDDVDYQRVVQTCRQMRRRVSGHGGEIKAGDEPAFDGYVAAGLQDDHCLINGVDLQARHRRGLKMFLVEAPGRWGALDRLLGQAIADKLSFRQMCMCIDNSTVMDMVADRCGYLDHLVAKAIDLGVSPVEAFRMVTVNPAEHFRLSARIGSIAPGRKADILLMTSPRSFPPEKVIVAGKVVAERGRLTCELPAAAIPGELKRTVQVGHIDPAKLQCPVDTGAGKARVRVIEARDGAAYNRQVLLDLPVVDGLIQPDIAGDVLKMSIVERYGRNGNVAVAFVRGFGLKRGAIATSMSVPANNIVTVGTNDADMWRAVTRLGEINGGFVVVDGGEVVSEVPFPICGMMADMPFETLVERVEATQDVVKELGSPFRHPFLTMAHTVLSTLPELGMTDMGLIDVASGALVPNYVAEARLAG